MGIGGLGIGDWGLGIGDWAQSPIPIISIYLKNYIYLLLFLLSLFKKDDDFLIYYKYKKYCFNYKVYHN